jgi:hypothetical protein
MDFWTGGIMETGEWFGEKDERERGFQDFM